MTPRSARRERLLRLRTIEHRIATLKLANADATVANLLRIAARLEKLRNGLGVDSGERTGMELNSIAEMTLRLESARLGMKAPLDDAHARRSEFLAHRIAAQRREDGAAKLLAKAESDEVVSYDRRTDANRQHVKRNSFFWKVK